jgi:aconitase A
MWRRSASACRLCRLWWRLPEIPATASIFRRCRSGLRSTLRMVGPAPSASESTSTATMRCCRRRQKEGRRSRLTSGSSLSSAHRCPGLSRRERLLRCFYATGTEILQPACGAFANCGPGTSTSTDQVTVSAFNRNFPGRSGPREVWLASPPTDAASAIAGEPISFDESRARFDRTGSLAQ